MSQSIDKNSITKVGLLGEPCPTCGERDNLNARAGSNGKTCLYHNKCGHLEELSIPWSEYVDNCIKGGWVRYGIDGKTLVDPSCIRPGMEKAVYREPGAKTKEGCFIATAVYGDSDTVELHVLRSFRDTILLRYQLGRMCVNLYYKWSPPVASYLARNELPRRIVRTMLDRVVRLLKERK